MDWDLLGHEWAVNLLAGHVALGAVRHAYLLTGSKGVGKRTLALRLAQALTCEKPGQPGEYCRTCHTCQRIEKMQHPDLFIVQAEGSGGILKVDQVRELQHSLALAPYEARYRVALLLRFEEANQNAANALLKTLEEPASQVVIILTAVNAESLLPTIVSRCEVLRLRPLPMAQLAKGLRERTGVSPEQADLFAHLSGGNPGRALQLSQQPEILAQRTAWLDSHRELLGGNLIKRFAFADKSTRMSEENDKAKLRAMLVEWLSLWRDVLLRASASAVPLCNLDRLDEINELAVRYGKAAAEKMLASLIRTLELLEKNINARLAMEVLMLDLPRKKPA